ncbi:MAG: 4'-phosphopantetheinyl transferase [Granulosicoccus sp.]
MTDKYKEPVESPIKGLTFAPEWAGTNLFLVCEPVHDRVEQLHEEELPYIAKAVPLRRNTFSSGRACAREALTQAGLLPRPLLRMPDGSVKWPEGIYGSISHTDHWAVAAVAVATMTEAASIGIDLEPVRKLDKGVINLIATPGEQVEIAEQRSPEWHATALFSLKESVYKCLRPLYGRFFDFHDVQISDVASGRPQLRFLARDLIRRFDERALELRMAITTDHVFTLVWLRQN